jgi:glycosyltransferase involved in cell wall biosynthesis
MTLNVAINAQLIPGSGAGGTQTFLIGLVNALGRLDGPEHYVLVGPREEPDWLRPYIGKNQRIACGTRTQALKRVLRPLKSLVTAARRGASWISNDAAGWPRLAQSNGFFEGLGCEVVHFPYQHFMLSRLPAIFNPHDLQHVHYPQFFSETDLTWREVTYGAACRAATTVVVHSNFVKQDVIRHYGIEASRVQVILSPPPIEAYREPPSATLEAVRVNYRLPERFAFYPAMTWEHKNHVRLLDATAVLRDQRGVKLNLICTGRQTEFFVRIRKKIDELRLGEQVRFLGMISPEHLRAVYRLAQFVVLPSLFEGAGLPLVEAWVEGTPVTCSGVTSLSEFAGDAALMFDPFSATAIADAMLRMATDEPLLRHLKQRGLEQVKPFKWETSAKTYRALYRRAAGQVLNEEDQWLLGGVRD